MYYFRNGYTVKVLESDKTYECHKRSTLPVKLKKFDVIPTDKYKKNLDYLIEEKNIPKELIKSEEPKIGDLVKLSNTLFRIEYLVDNENLAVNILSTVNEEYQENKSSLTEDECNVLGIEYKSGLFSFNPGMKLKVYDPNKKEWDVDDLSTYPTRNDEVRYMILKLKNFSRESIPDIVKTPDGKYTDVELFLVSLNISMKDDISTFSDMSSWKKGEELSWSLILNDFKGSTRVEPKDLCDVDGNIYVIVSFVKNNKGISTYSLKDKKIMDLLEVSWDSSFSSEENKEEIVLLEEEPIQSRIFEERGGIHWRLTEKGDSNRQVYKKLICLK